MNMKPIWKNRKKATAAASITTLAIGFGIAVHANEPILETEDADPNSALLDELTSDEIEVVKRGPGCTRDEERRSTGRCSEDEFSENSVPDYSLDLGRGSSGDSNRSGQMRNPFASRLEPGLDSGATDLIGDFLKSGGLVRLNFKPGGITPPGANQNGFLVRDGDRFLFTDNNGNAFNPANGPLTVFRAPSGFSLDDPYDPVSKTGVRQLNPDGTFTFQNLDRVTFDTLGNQTSLEPNKSVHQNSPSSTQFTGRVDTPVAALVNPAVANVGVIKAAEGSNPVPRDRVFLFYSFFDGVQLGDPNGISVNRFTPGFEKTFFNGTASFEARFPFATTLDSNFNFTSGFANSTNNPEFGDILLTLKSILMQGDNWLISGGTQVSLPTADDLRFVFTDSVQGVSQTSEYLRIENQAVHVMPLIAGMWLPDDRWFVQGFTQLDFDTTGKPVLLNQNPFVPGSTLQSIGRFNDATFLYADVSVGYWLMRDPPESIRTITGFAPQLELHYNRSLTRSDIVTSTDVAQVGSGARNIEVLNLTVGGAIELWHQTLLSVGFCTPLTGGNDDEFNGELRVLISHRFGGGRSFSGTPSNR